MAGVRDERQRVFLPGSAPGRRSPAVLVMLLLAVLAAIALMWNVSRRSERRAPPPQASAGAENIESSAATAPEAEPPPGAAAAAIAPPATADELAPAGEAPTRVPPLEEPGTARNRVEIGRVIDEGRAGLTACYQRALVRDTRLVRGSMNVQLSVAPSGRVSAVNISGPAAFRRMQPCLKEAISKWTFPTADAPYATEFAIAFRGKE